MDEGGRDNRDMKRWEQDQPVSQSCWLWRDMKVIGAALCDCPSLACHLVFCKRTFRMYRNGIGCHALTFSERFNPLSKPRKMLSLSSFTDWGRDFEPSYRKHMIFPARTRSNSNSGLRHLCFAPRPPHTLWVLFSLVSGFASSLGPLCNLWSIAVNF